MQKNSDYTRELYQQIQVLSNTAESNVDDMALMQFKIEQLNELVPELALAYDAQSRVLNRSSAELERYVQAEQAQLTLTSQLEEQQRIAAVLPLP
ncbi:hypothetical protein FACS1894188_05160 [Clostridia bacterium]|nr:hypothetical protein FACS1894188_05160 [Clostridia bacterium]